MSKSNVIHSFRSRKQSAGFTLIELLVAMAVLSIGLLGLGLMQVNGLRFTKSSYWHTQAMFLASDIADRIRANVNNVNSYIGSYTPTTATAHPSCIGGTICGTTALVASDLTDWQNRLYQEFPGANGQIVKAGSTTSCYGATGATVINNSIRVILSWSEINSSNQTQNLAGGSSAGDCYQFDFIF